MKLQIKYRRSFVVIGMIVSLVFVMTNCINGEKKDKPVEEEADVKKFESYAGAEKCAACHKNIYEKHLMTAHHFTSQPAEKKYIKGSFEKDHNQFRYTSSLLLSMEKRDSGFYQVVYFKNEEKMAMPFNIVIGSGVMGQSYLTRRGDRLYQMPITYFTAAHQWSNSPGFPNDKVLTDRPVTARCLECHATFAQGEGGTDLEPLSFPADKLIFGVGCEKCHGPAAMHVDYQIKHPDDTTAKYIINPAALSRQRQLDICAMCHGGKIQKNKPSFTFTAGKDLADYFNTNSINQAAMSTGEVEVHGNQYGLLQASKCFQQSQLTCNTCHNTHENERGDMTLFSQRCMDCHNINDNNFKTLSHKDVSIISKNCIDCHMPQQPSKAISVYLQGKNEMVSSMIRSHFIAIYPEEAKKFLNK
jgi:hypothetical protein